MTVSVIRVHVGSHKTVTTYFQEMLLVNRAKSAACCVVYWSMSMTHYLLRSAVKAYSASGEKKLFGLLPIKDQTGQATLADLIDLLRIGMSLTISDENILGDAADNYSGRIYPRIRMELEVLRHAMPDGPVEIWLSVRFYAPFLASMCGESLRHDSFMTLKKYLHANKDCEGQWPRLVDQIIEIFPQVKIVAWAYEDFRRLEPQFLSELGGFAYANMDRLGKLDVLPSSSATAIEQMIEAAPALSRQERIFRMLAMQGQFPKTSNSERFAPWSAQDREALDKQYARTFA